MDERFILDEPGEFEENLQEVEDEIEDEYIEKDRTHKIHTMKPIQAFGILVNYIIGTGVFGLPLLFKMLELGYH
jgi:hypothetical protein